MRVGKPPPRCACVVPRRFAYAFCFLTPPVPAANAADARELWGMRGGGEGSGGAGAAEGPAAGGGQPAMAPEAAQREMTFLMIQTLRASPCQAPPRPTRGSTASPVRAPECARPPASAPARPCGRVLCRTDAMRYPPVAPRMPRGPWRRRPISWASSGTSSTLTAPCARARLRTSAGCTHRSGPRICSASRSPAPSSRASARGQTTCTYRARSCASQSRGARRLQEGAQRPQLSCSTRESRFEASPMRFSASGRGSWAWADARSGDRRYSSASSFRPRSWGTFALCTV